MGITSGEEKKTTIPLVMLSILLSWGMVSFSPVFPQGQEDRVKEPLLRLLPLRIGPQGLEARRRAGDC